MKIEETETMTITLTLEDVVRLLGLEPSTVNAFIKDGFVTVEQQLTRPTTAQKSIVRLLDFGNSKIPVIKCLREFMRIGLKPAKDLVESTPVNIGLFAHEYAQRIKEAIEDVGGVVEIVEFAGV